LKDGDFFLVKKVNEKRGKIVSIRSNLEIEGYTVYKDNQYTPQASNDLSISSNNSFIIHYKCHEKVEYEPQIKEFIKQGTKNL
jgi:hypothetical protein